MTEPGFAFDVESTAGHSLGELVSQALEESADEAAAVDRLEMLLAESELRLPATMGSDRLSRLLRRFAKRRFVEELPAIVAQLCWLELHVPANASVALVSEHEQERKGELKMSVLGSGGGAACTTKMTSKEESQGRTVCADFVLDVRVRPVLFEIDGRESLELNAEAVVGQTTVPRRPCHSCGAAAELIQASGWPVEPYVNLVADEVATVITKTIRSEARASAKTGVRVPQIAVEAGVELQTGSTASLSLAYTLPAGHRYLQYRPGAAGQPLLVTPSWTVTDG